VKFATVALAMCLILMRSKLQAENWPGWRGPQGDGSSVEKNLPTQWSATENVAWKVEAPCLGHSSPIVWDKHIFVVGVKAGTESRTLVAIDSESGKTLWEKEVLKAPLERIHKLNSHASSTPATDGKLVYVSFLNGKQMFVAAYDFAGNQVWSDEPGIFSSVHGYCSSPVLFENLVIVNGDHDGEAYLVALDRDTGKTVWKTPRENRTRSYCTPLIREINGRLQLMLSGSKCVASFDPRTGNRQWIFDGPTEQFVASPVYSHGLLFITGGFPDKHILSINPDGNGNITKDNIVWHYKKGTGVSYVPSPIAIGDYFLVASDDGVGTCFDLKSGNVLWQKRLAGHYSGSLLSANGLAYFTSDDGVTKIIKPGPELEIVATSQIDDACYASLAASNGKLFIRGEKYLWCVGKKAE
jgi:outer membrane protein assembly factor BamB